MRHPCHFGGYSCASTGATGTGVLSHPPHTPSMTRIRHPRQRSEQACTSKLVGINSGGQVNKDRVHRR